MSTHRYVDNTLSDNQDIGGFPYYKSIKEALLTAGSFDTIILTNTSASSYDYKECVRLIGTSGSSLGFGSHNASESLIIRWPDTAESFYTGVKPKWTVTGASNHGEYPLQLDGCNNYTIKNIEFIGAEGRVGGHGLYLNNCNSCSISESAAWSPSAPVGAPGSSTPWSRFGIPYGIFLEGYGNYIHIGLDI